MGGGVAADVSCGGKLGGRLGTVTLLAAADDERFGQAIGMRINAHPDSMNMASLAWPARLISVCQKHPRDISSYSG